MDCRSDLEARGSSFCLALNVLQFFLSCSGSLMGLSGIRLSCIQICPASCQSPVVQLCPKPGPLDPGQTAYVVKACITCEQLQVAFKLHSIINQLNVCRIRCKPPELGTPARAMTAARQGLSNALTHLKTPPEAPFKTPCFTCLANSERLCYRVCICGKSDGPTSRRVVCLPPLGPYQQAGPQHQQLLCRLLRPGLALLPDPALAPQRSRLHCPPLLLSPESMFKHTNGLHTS